jgi:hypothetical protein
MTTREAHCSCGQLTLNASGDPVRISVCHCFECQRRTGSAFGVQARFPRERVQIGGHSHEYVRTGDSGQAISFHFCPHCGTTVYWTLAHAPEIIAVAVGAFADPAFATPQFSVYGSRQHPWVQIPAYMQREG